MMPAAAPAPAQPSQPQPQAWPPNPNAAVSIRGLFKHFDRKINLKWEKTLSWNVGIDLSLFQNNMEISFDYYKKETSDIVVEKEIPIENGFRKMYINSGAIDSEGYELQVKLSPLSTRDWSWTVN